MKKLTFALMLVGCASGALKKQTREPVLVEQEGVVGVDKAPEEEVLEDDGWEAAHARCRESEACARRGMCEATSERQDLGDACLSKEEVAELSEEEIEVMGAGPPFLHCSDAFVCAATEEGCAASKDCKALGDCSVVSQKFVPQAICGPGSKEDCHQSQACREKGLCEFVVEQEDVEISSCQRVACEKDEECKEFGACGFVWGEEDWTCQPLTEEHCQQSTGCKVEGLCARRKEEGVWSCVATNTSHCQASEECVSEGRCIHDSVNMDCVSP